MNVKNSPPVEELRSLIPRNNHHMRFCASLPHRHWPASPRCRSPPHRTSWPSICRPRFGSGSATPTARACSARSACAASIRTCRPPRRCCGTPSTARVSGAARIRRAWRPTASAAGSAIYNVTGAEHLGLDEVGRGDRARRGDRRRHRALPDARWVTTRGPAPGTSATTTARSGSISTTRPRFAGCIWRAASGS